MPHGCAWLGSRSPSTGDSANSSKTCSGNDLRLRPQKATFSHPKRWQAGESVASLRCLVSLSSYDSAAGGSTRCRVSFLERIISGARRVIDARPGLSRSYAPNAHSMPEASAACLDVPLGCGVRNRSVNIAEHEGSNRSRIEAYSSGRGVRAPRNLASSRRDTSSDARRNPEAGATDHAEQQRSDHPPPTTHHPDATSSRFRRAACRTGTGASILLPIASSPFPTPPLPLCALCPLW